MTLEEFDLTDRGAVITGGAGVPATAISRGLVEHGACIACLDIDQARTDCLVRDLESRGHRAWGLATDALDRQALVRSADLIMETFGRVDILVNAAGGNRMDATASPESIPFFDLSPDALQWVFNLNFLSAVLASQVFGKIMTAQGRGVILNISSMAAFRPLTRTVAYSAAKAAISNFTQWPCTWPRSTVRLFG